MNAFSQLTPPLETFSGLLALLPRFVQVCLRTMPWLLIAAVAIAAGQMGLASFAPAIQQAGIGLNLAILLPLAAMWIALITASNSFISSTISVALGTTTIPLGQALTIAAFRLPRAIGYTFVTILLIVLGFFCLVLPGIYLALRLFPVALVALFEPNVNVIKRSWEVTEGYTVEVFFGYILAFLVTLVPSVAIGLIVGFLPSVPGLAFLLTAIEALLTYCIPFVFWLLLYGWFRAEIYDPPAASPEGAYATA